MTEIIPGVIPRSFDDLKEKLEVLVGRVPMAHVDVMDSTFTPESSWPYISTSGGDGEAGDFLKIVDEVEGFPFWDEVSFEAHLMVKNPEDIVEDWVRAGAERIIIHFEALEDPKATLFALKNRFSSSSSFLQLEIGLAVNFDTPIENILPFVLEADFIQLMSIGEIGKQGNKFEPGIFARIRELKAKFPETIMAVDGGVTLEHAEELIEAGVDRLVVGSAIFGAEDPGEALEQFLEISH